MKISRKVTLLLIIFSIALFITPLLCRAEDTEDEPDDGERAVDMDALRRLIEELESDE